MIGIYLNTDDRKKRKTWLKKNNGLRLLPYKTLTIDRRPLYFISFIGFYTVVAFYPNAIPGDAFASLFAQYQDHGNSLAKKLDEVHEEDIDYKKNSVIS